MLDMSKYLFVVKISCWKYLIIYMYIKEVEGNIKIIIRKLLKYVCLITSLKLLLKWSKMIVTLY